MSLYEKIVLTETEADCKCTKKYKTDYSRVKEQAAGINMCTIIGQLPTGTTSRRQPEYGIDSPFNQVGAQGLGVNLELLVYLSTKECNHLKTSHVSVEGDQVPPGHTSSQATKKIRAIKAGTLQQLVNNLLTASGDGDSNYTRIFLSTYRAFASPEAVLDLLLDRYRECDWEENDEQRSPETRNAITSVLRAWLDLCSEDFCEVPNYTCLQKLLEHLRQTMPGSDLEKRAHQLLEQFQQQDLAAQELDNSYHGKIMFNRGEEGDAKVEEVEDKQDIFSFPSGLVAEQLTYMDAELFKKVVIHHCLGCIWSQRHKKQNQHLATTIRATITQFNNITKCVISSILKDRNLKPDQRARLLEKWITIAEKSRTINNYSSLRAIVAALQSSPIYKLRKTWAAVSNELQILDVLAGLPETLWCTSNNWLIARSLSSFCSRMSSMGLFEELEEQCCHRINYHLGEEDVMQGTVPYLGTFLTDLTMLDTALPDYVGDLINFEKKRREFEVIAQIKLLKSACNNYCITSVPKFLRWFNNQQYLTDEESYNVSREIEAAPESSPSSPKDRKSLVKCLSLLFHGTEVAERTPSKSSDQPKSPRIGSSGENMDSSSEVSSHSPIRPVDTVSSGVSSSLSSVSSSSSSSSHTPKVPRRSIFAAVCSWIQKRSVRTTSGNWALKCSASVTACISKVAFPGCRQKNGHDNIGIRQEDDDLYQSTLLSVIFGNFLLIFKHHNSTQPLDEFWQRKYLLAKCLALLGQASIQTVNFCTSEFNNYQRASSKQTVETEPPEDSQFTQAISQDQDSTKQKASLELVISEKANVFHAWYPANLDLLLRIPNSDEQTWLRTQSCSTLPRAPKEGTLTRTLSRITVVPVSSMDSKDGENETRGDKIEMFPIQEPTAFCLQIHCGEFKTCNNYNNLKLNVHVAKFMCLILGLHNTFTPSGTKCDLKKRHISLKGSCK
ncbi:ral guanine nucleotide dissociation stimulator-like 1 [Heterodontus francisci]|uniref:ral guanine nucleotide dissociation stimulator-like 1 n=1 Tax=Heterodontus francisci TaxID=7792 RepID=UPI00355BAE52